MLGYRNKKLSFRLTEKEFVKYLSLLKSNKITYGWHGRSWTRLILIALEELWMRDQTPPPAAKAPKIQCERCGCDILAAVAKKPRKAAAGKGGR